MSKVRRRKVALDPADARHEAEHPGHAGTFVPNEGPPIEELGGSLLLRCGSIELDRRNKRALRSGRQLRLRPKEFSLLELLILHCGSVLSRVQIVELAWCEKGDMDLRTVDVTVGRLRKAVNRGWLPDPIRSVRGQGYKFQADQDDLDLQSEHTRRLRLSRSE